MHNHVVLLAPCKGASGQQQKCVFFFLFFFEKSVRQRKKWQKGLENPPNFNPSLAVFGVIGRCLEGCYQNQVENGFSPFCVFSPLSHFARNDRIEEDLFAAVWVLLVLN